MSVLNAWLRHLESSRCKLLSEPVSHTRWDFAQFLLSMLAYLTSLVTGKHFERREQSERISLVEHTSIEALSMIHYAGDDAAAAQQMHNLAAAPTYIRDQQIRSSFLPFLKFLFRSSNRKRRVSIHKNYTQPLDS